jgi:hypothetical protein
MNAEFKLAGSVPMRAFSAWVNQSSSTGTTAAGAEVDDIAGDNAGLRDEIDGIARARRRADAESTADEKLAALKRRMGK